MEKSSNSNGTNSMIRRGGGGGGALPLASLNHISLLCRSVEASAEFYQNVLGFIRVRRPGSLNFSGEWLFNYGIGIHLLRSENPEAMPNKTVINPRDNHISFQCESMIAVETKLKEKGVPYVHQRVEEGGIYVDQLFFHDPDGFMIEICNCENLPVIPVGVVDGDLGLLMAPACKRVTGLMQQQQQQQQQKVLLQHAAAAAAVAAAPAVCVGAEEPQSHIPCA